MSRSTIRIGVVITVIAASAWYVAFSRPTYGPQPDPTATVTE